MFAKFLRKLIFRLQTEMFIMLNLIFIYVFLASTNFWIFFGTTQIFQHTDNLFEIQATSSSQHLLLQQAKFEMRDSFEENETEEDDVTN